VFNPSMSQFSVPLPVPFTLNTKLFGIFAVFRRVSRFPSASPSRVPLPVRFPAAPLFLRVSLFCIVFKVRSAPPFRLLSDPLASELG